MKRLIISAAAAVGLATTAMAADIPDPVEPIAPEVYGPTVFNWTGAYVGATLGGGFGTADTKSGGSSHDIGVNGVVGGAYGGYNYQVTPNFLVGGEGDFLFSGQQGDSRFSGSKIKQRAQWLASIRGRAGVTFDRFLVYGTGGVAFAGLETEVPGGSKTKNKVGWTLGAGAEYAITDNIIGRLDYQYAAFGDDTTRIGGRSVKSNFNNNVVKVGVAYKF